MLNTIEQDFIAFMAERNNESTSEVQNRYEATKQVIDFASKEFRVHCDTNNQALQISYE